MPESSDSQFFFAMKAMVDAACAPFGIHPDLVSWLQRDVWPVISALRLITGLRLWSEGGG